MSDYKGVFDWVQFPEGRARFSGGIRGIDDEQGHETYAVEVGGTEYFGEIEAVFLSNQNDYNIRVISFGYGNDKYVGLPMLSACRVFTTIEINTVRALIMKLIFAGLHFSQRPFLLLESPSSQFMGDIVFRNAWALINNSALEATV